MNTYDGCRVDIGSIPMSPFLFGCLHNFIAEFFHGPSVLIHKSWSSISVKVEVHIGVSVSHLLSRLSYMCSFVTNLEKVKVHMCKVVRNTGHSILSVEPL